MMSTVDEISKMLEQLYTIDRIITAMQKKPHTYMGVQLYANEAHTLKAIAEEEGISQNDLSDRMLRTKGATSVMVDKLVEKGLVLREREQGNQRRYLLTLTDKGRQVNADHLAFDLSYANDLAQSLNFSENDVRVVNRTLQKTIHYYTEHYLLDGQKITSPDGLQSP